MCLYKFPRVLDKRFCVDQRLGIRLYFAQKFLEKGDFDQCSRSHSDSYSKQPPHNASKNHALSLEPLLHAVLEIKLLLYDHPM